MIYRESDFALRTKTDFGNLKLWIIQDDDYSKLRSVEGCESFADLPATKTDVD